MMRPSEIVTGSMRNDNSMSPSLSPHGPNYGEDNEHLRMTRPSPNAAKSVSPMKKKLNLQSTENLHQAQQEAEMEGGKYATAQKDKGKHRRTSAKKTKAAEAFEKTQTSLPDIGRGASKVEEY